MKTNTYNINGRLEMLEDSYTYIVKDGDKVTNLSEILNNTYQLEKPVVYMAVSMKGREVLHREGYLYYTPDGCNVLSPFLEGANIDEFLFNNTEKYMDIVIRVTEDMEASK